MRILIYILVGVILVSCNGDRKDDCITSLGKDIVELREVSPFTKLYVEDRVTVILVQDSSRLGEIELSGPEGVIPQIESEVKDGVIRLTNNNTCNFVRSFEYSIEVKVYVDVLEEIHIESIATVTNEGALDVENLRIVNYALSDSYLNLTG
ncbi:MAG: GIN domain-containing protein, partial [Bacteroidia bacterium]